LVEETGVPGENHRLTYFIA